MQIKRFEAKDMTEALKMIKNEFGSQAVILSAKTLKKSSGIFGAVRKAGVEITAASDRYPAIDYQDQAAVEENDVSNLPDSLLPSDDKVSIFQNKFKKHYTDSDLNSANFDKNNFESPLIKKLRLSLEEQGLTDPLAKQIIEKITTETQHQHAIGLEEIRTIFNRTVNEKIAIANALEIRGDQATIVAFVGPTGVGKTTTIAKLSAINALEKKYWVALISLDHQRIGATATLEKYARIIGLPYKTVETKEELRSAVDAFRNHHFILIDTPGIAVIEREKINRLAEHLSCISPDEVHLLLSAGTKDQDMIRLCKTYAACRTNRLIFTKIDETIGFGNLLNLLERKELPLAYVTNGQQIPENIIAVQSNTIADLIFNTAYALSRPDKTALMLKENIFNSESASLPEGDYFIANKNSDIFHHRNCKSVERINMNNVIVFQSMSDARMQNFKPCRMCCHEKIGSDRLTLRFKQKIAASV